MLALGSDHGGFLLKQEIEKHLRAKGYDIMDFGTTNTDSVDYPEYGLAVAEAIKEGKCDKGIIVCGTGIGISIAANKIPGIRAALCIDTTTARLSREHNDANILALGGRIIGLSVALDIVDTWLTTDFLGGRHAKRICKISEIEKKYLR